MPLSTRDAAMSSCSLGDGIGSSPPLTQPTNNTTAPRTSQILRLNTAGEHTRGSRGCRTELVTMKWAEIPIFPAALKPARHCQGWGRRAHTSVMQTGAWWWVAAAWLAVLV